MAGEMPGWYCWFLAAAKSGNASAIRAGDGLATTNSVTVTATGGVAGYTYAWTRISGADFNISSASAATVTWNFTTTAPSDISETWRCTVTDSGTPSSTATVDVTVRIQHIL